MPGKRNILWLASYPKSGNTWVAAVLEDLGYKHGFARGTYDAYRLQATGQVPVVCEGLGGGVLPAPCSVLKTHAPFDPRGLPHRFQDIDPVSAGYIHIYRNPLDVLLSYIAFTRLEYRTRASDASYRRRLFVELLGFSEPVAYEDWQYVGLDRIPQEHLDHALDVFGSNDMVIPTLGVMCGGWLDHWRSWMQAAQYLPGHSFRYEDCLMDPARFAALADVIPSSADSILSSVMNVNAATERKARDGSRRDQLFFSRRQAGYFRDHFSGAAIDRFAARHGAGLVETGYGSIAGRRHGN